MFLIQRITHTPTRDFILTISKENESKLDAISKLSVGNATPSNTQVITLYKTGDEVEAKDMLAKLSKVEEQNDHFIGSVLDEKEEEAPKKTSSVKKTTSEEKEKTSSKTKKKSYTKKSSDSDS